MEIARKHNEYVLPPDAVGRQHLRNLAAVRVRRVTSCLDHPCRICHAGNHGAAGRPGRPCHESADSLSGHCEQPFRVSQSHSLRATDRGS